VKIKAFPTNTEGSKDRAKAGDLNTLPIRPSGKFLYSAQGAAAFEQRKGGLHKGGGGEAGWVLREKKRNRHLCFAGIKKEKEL